MICDVKCSDYERKISGDFWNSDEFQRMRTQSVPGPLLSFGRRGLGTRLTTVRDRELVKFIPSFRRLKTKFKRHLPGEFHECSWVFWSWHCSRKNARRAEERKKKEEENEDDETRFSPFPGSSL